MDLDASLDKIDIAADIICSDCDADRCPGYKVCPEVISFAQLVELED